MASNYPNAIIPNIFTFLWCLWKAQNDALFSRKESLPHYILLAAAAISSAQFLQDHQEDCASSSLQRTDTRQILQVQVDEQIMQGYTVKSDFLITGTKIYSDASWRKKNIPGRAQGLGTGIGVFIHISGHEIERKIMIQASTSDAHSPLCAEALALQLAARVVAKLQIQQATFFTDNLSLAKMAASRNINDNSINWGCRTPISNFLQDTSSIQTAIYHINRNINGIAHDCAH